MKAFNQSILFIMAFAAISTFTACKKDSLPNGGEPRITYVRITNPNSSDSLLVAAPQGKLIAIMGENLGEAVEIWLYKEAVPANTCSFVL